MVHSFGRERFEAILEMDAFGAKTVFPESNIKKETMDELKLEPNDFSNQCDMPVIKIEYIVKSEQSSLEDIKEETIDKLKLESNDFSSQCDIPVIENEYVVKSEQSNFEFDESRITIKSEFNLADAFVTGIENDTNITPKVISSKNHEYQCDICKTSFLLKHILTKHMKSIHANIYSVTKSYNCFFCYKKFACFSNLFKHSQKHTSQKNTPSNNRKKHTIKNSFECNDSGKQFIEKTSLVIHTREKPYACDLCQSAFSCKGSLEIHAKKHTGEKPFACHVCQKMFADKRSLIRHGRIHTGEKPYECTVGKKTFSRMSSLIRHARIHTREKPYACDICHKTFAVKCSLIRHGRIHTGEKPHACDICQVIY